MTTHRWSIADGFAAEPHRAGEAGTLTGAWTTAIGAGWGALVAGDLGTLAVTIDGMPEAVYTPARGTTGGLDPADVLGDLVEMHRDVTADEVARQLLAESEATDL